MEKRAILSEIPPTTTSIEVQQKGRPLIKEIQKLPKRVKKLIEKLPHQEVSYSVLGSNFILGLLGSGQLYLFLTCRSFTMCTLYVIEIVHAAK